MVNGVISNVLVTEHKCGICLSPNPPLAAACVSEPPDPVPAHAPGRKAGSAGAGDLSRDAPDTPPRPPSRPAGPGAERQPRRGSPRAHAASLSAAPRKSRRNPSDLASQAQKLLSLTGRCTGSSLIRGGSAADTADGKCVDVISPVQIHFSGVPRLPPPKRFAVVNIPAVFVALSLSRTPIHEDGALPEPRAAALARGLGDPASPQALRAGLLGGLLQLVEIGRASCRERVSTSV